MSIKQTIADLTDIPKCPKCHAQRDEYEFIFDMCQTCYYHNPLRRNEATLPNQVNNQFK